MHRRGHRPAVFREIISFSFNIGVTLFPPLSAQLIACLPSRIETREIARIVLLFKYVELLWLANSIPRFERILSRDSATFFNTINYQLQLIESA